MGSIHAKHGYMITIASLFDSLIIKKLLCLNFIGNEKSQLDSSRTH